MTADASNSDDRSRQIDAAIAEYLEALEQGTPLDREAFLAQHADIAGELRQFLEDDSALKRDAPRPVTGRDGDGRPVQRFRKSNCGCARASRHERATWPLPWLPAPRSELGIVC